MLNTIVYDIETTGLYYDKNRIIQIAGYNVNTEEYFNEYINPGPKHPISEEVTNINNITNEILLDKENAKVILSKFIEFCGEKCYLIAHNNNGFDRLFLLSELKRNKFPKQKWKYLDTLTLARKELPELNSHTLDKLRDYYQININKENTHNALVDTKDLYEIYMKLTNNKPIETVYKECKEYIIEIMPFGKHKGKQIKEIPEDYVMWLKSTHFFKDLKNMELKKTFQHYDFNVD